MTTVDVREVVPTVQPAASRPRLLFAVVVLSTLAGGVHLAVADHHFEQGWLFGSFFGAALLAIGLRMAGMLT